MLIGHDHTTRGVINGVNSVCHRIDFAIDPNQTYDKIKHALVHTKYYDETYTNPKSLYEILSECILFNVIPFINLNACWWYKEQMLAKISKEGLAKIAGILRDYLKERGFVKGKAFISVFNEPGKWLTKETISDYTDEVHNKVGNDFDVVFGNDEWNMLDWSWLGINCRAKILGVHHLSSIGNWNNPKATFQNIKDAATLAATYGKKIAGTECGSWFKKYCGEGHRINKDIILECKKYGYLACLIVSVDINENDYNGIIGYRIWDHTFTNLLNPDQLNYFNDFINFIKKEGYQMEYEAPQKLQAVANILGFKIGNYKPELPILTGTGFWQNAINHKRGEPLIKADFDSAMEKILKTLFKFFGISADLDVYYKPDGSWNPDWEQIAKSNPKE